jgi:hypothetical protein
MAAESDDGVITEFGFAWGPVEVVRAMTLPLGRVLTIRTASREIDVYVSTAGRSVRVFSGGREWKPSP